MNDRRIGLIAVLGPDGTGVSTIGGLTSLLGGAVKTPYAGDNPEGGGRPLPTTRLLWWYRRRTSGPPVHGPPPIERFPRRSLARRVPPPP